VWPDLHGGTYYLEIISASMKVWYGSQIKMIFITSKVMIDLA